MKNFGRKLVVAILVIDAIILIVKFFGYEFLYTLSNHLMPDFIISKPTASGHQTVLCLIIAAIECLLASIDKDKLYTKIAAILTPILSLVGYLVLSYFYQGYSIGIDGKNTYYIVTPDCNIHFSLTPGVDSQYGLQLKETNADVVVAYNWFKGQRVDKLGRAFQFCEESNNVVKIYDNPFTSNPCDIRPVCTREQLERYQEQQDKKLKREQRKQQVVSINGLLTEALNESEKCKLSESCGYSGAIELINQARLIDSIYRDIKIVENKVSKKHKYYCEKSNEQLEQQITPKRDSNPYSQEPRRFRPAPEFSEPSQPTQPVKRVEPPQAQVPQPIQPKYVPAPRINSEIVPVAKYNKVLMALVLKGQRDQVKQMISRGVEINSQNEEGKTALMIAIENGHNDIAKDLISYGADVNKQDGNGVTALIFAAKGGHDELTGILLSKGTNIDQQNNSGMTALMYAVIGGHDDVVKCLLNRRANINLLDNRNLRALDYATKNRSSKIISLLKQKAD